MRDISTEVRRPAEPPREWVETAAAAAGGSLLVFLLTRPAFGVHFFSENFQYLGQYLGHDSSFFRALLAPTGGIFFRPVFFAFSLPWSFILPDEPLLWHLRNFLFTGINIVLLHRLLLRLVSWRPARLRAVALFAASKVHLTTIGYLNLFDSIVMLMLLLAALLFHARYLERGRGADYAAAIGFAILSVFSKDFGLVACLVIAAFVALMLHVRGQWGVRRWGRLVIPLAIIVVAYLAVRASVVEQLPDAGSPYAPRLSLDLSSRKALLFASALFNVSLFDDGTAGGPGLAGALAGLTGGGRHSVMLAELAMLTLLAGIACWMLVRGRIDSRALAFCAVWIGAYLAPTFLTRNLQIYYGYESIAGAAVLAGLLLDRMRNRRSLRIATALLVLLVSNAAVSNRPSKYIWGTIAADAESAVTTLRSRYGDRLPPRLVIVARNPMYWAFVLGDGSGTPMLPWLFEMRDVEIAYAPRGTSLEGYEEVLDADLELAVRTGRESLP
ncbi:MAG TPA: hypothetical protein VMT00_13820 [Thermoanaerobaculia bacterium]|nr:hypothetical protein [Thermoanaerobaculia bacterium]